MACRSARSSGATTGHLQGALSDLQAHHVGELVRAAGQRFDYRSFPEVGHAMHTIDPKLYAGTLRDWLADVLPSAHIR